VIILYKVKKIIWLYFQGLCYAEFAARVPKAGSAYVYSYVSVGEFIAFTIGWNLILEYVIGASSVARGLSGYIDALFDYKMKSAMTNLIPLHVDFLAEYPDFLSFAIVSILTIILALGVKESSFVHTFFTTINMFTVILVIISGFYKLNPSYWSIEKENIPEGVRGGEGGFMPFGIAGVMAGAAKCFYGFVGFDCVATAGEEAKNAKRNIPLAMIFTLIICVIIYILIAVVLTMMWPYYLQDPEAPLPHIYHQLGWNEIRWIISIGAIFALFSGLLGALFSMPRILYSMACDGVLFRFMSRVHPKTKTPMNATIISGLISAIMSAIFSLHQLVDMLSIGTLLAYTIVAICVLVLRYEYTESDDTMKMTDKNEQVRLRIAKKPTMASSKLAKSSIAIFIIFSTILSCIISYSHFTTTVAVIASFFGILSILVTSFISYLPTDRTRNISFKVPLVPWLPCFSIFCNTYLMLQLDIATWIRFVVWLIVGKYS
jgi:solute carrier family 7 (cationic amino acid transporter), member 3